MRSWQGVGLAGCLAAGCLDESVGVTEVGPSTVTETGGSGGAATTGGETETSVIVTTTVSPSGTGGSTGGESGCGDAVVDADEECDDGNEDDTDPCTAACKLNVCGDGIVLLGIEECDDGDADDTDSCTSMCKSAACGDGIVQGAEECDDGDKSNACPAKHPETTAPSLPGPFRCLAGFLRSPPEPARARLVVVTTREWAFLATRRQLDSRARRGRVAMRCHPRAACLARARCQRRTRRREPTRRMSVGRLALADRDDSRHRLRSRPTEPGCERLPRPVVRLREK